MIAQDGKLRLLRSFPAGNKHRDVVSVKQNLFQLCNFSPLGRCLELSNILQNLKKQF